MSKRTFTLVVVLIGLCALPAGSALGMPIEEALTQAVMDQYQLDSAEYDIEVVSNRLKISLVNPAVLSFEPISQRDPIGPFTIYVKITAGDECIDKGQVRLRISRFADVLVSRGSVKRHQLLTPDGFEVSRMDITSLREQPLRSFDEIAGMRSSQSLKRGEVVTVDDVETLPDVDIGEEVSIIFSDDFCTVTAPGRALEVGRKGERIRVKNKASGKIIEAQVEDSRTVSVGS